MIGLITLYSLCLISGYIVERCFSFNSLLKRIIIVLSVGAAQLILSIQLLSIQNWLFDWSLIVINCVLLCLVWFVARNKEMSAPRLTWKMLVLSACSNLKILLSDRFLSFTALIALLLIIISWIIGFTIIPTGDGYHYDKPLFWRQYHSIMPFECHNPRIIATSFASEALCFPGYVFCNSDKLLAALTLITVALCICLIFSIARQLGCSSIAAGYSAILATGYNVFSPYILLMSGDAFLAKMWSGACLLFLLDACPSEKNQSSISNLGWSIFCFVMSCGTKNSYIISAPFILICIIIILRGSFLRKDTFYRLVLFGSIALLCSGVVWNYTSNKLWFGNFKGPPFMQAHTSREFQPRSMWTRVARGATTFIFDTTWVPKSIQNEYSNLWANSLNIMGAKERLDEDESFWELEKKDMKPSHGFGLLGIFLLLPGIVLGMYRCFGGYHDKEINTFVRTKMAFLVIMTLGSSVLAHIMLRTQSGGFFCQLPFLLMAGAPLTAPLFDNLKARVFGLTLLVISAAMIIKLESGAIRFWDCYKKSTFLHKLIKLSKNHERKYKFTWMDKRAEEGLADEYNLFKEISFKFISKIDQPTVMGFISTGTDSDLHHLFGKAFINRIIPLTDIRDPGQIKETKEDIGYIIFYDEQEGSLYNNVFASTVDMWAQKHHYHKIFSAALDEHQVFVAYKKDILRTDGVVFTPQLYSDYCYHYVCRRPSLLNNNLL